MRRSAEDKKRRVWSGYECPACYAVFRVPKGNEHRPVHCPGCDAILRLSTQAVKTVLPSPDGEDRPAPVMEELEAVHEFTEVTSSGRVRKKRRRRKLAPGRGMSWDRGDKSRSRYRDAAVPVVLGLGVLGFAAAIYAVGWLFDEPEVEEQAPPPSAASLGLVLDDEEEGGGGKELPEDLSMREKEIARAARRFLEAPDVEALLATIRNRPAVEARVRAWYQKKPYRAPDVRAIAEDGAAGQLGALVSVNVTLEDFSVRPIALEWDGKRFLVDWESWVGYSEMDWSEFIAAKPLRARLFRVLVRPVNYYNFGFSDDSRWSCFELSMPGEGRVIYGYAESGSALDKELRPLDPEAPAAAYVLRLRFPEEAQTDNQVLIEKVLASGWVVANEKS